MWDRYPSLGTIITFDKRGALIVKSSKVDWGPKPFRFINSWLKEKGFLDLVKSKWSAYKLEGEGMVRCKEKLKMLKHELKIWNAQVFGNIYTKKRDVIAEIGELDIKDAELSLCEGEKRKIVQLLSDLKVMNSKIESLLRQKARVNWIMSGDSNTKFYHASLTWRRKSNQIKGVEVDGVWQEEPQVVRMEDKRLFEKRFSEPLNHKVRLGNVDFPKLTQEENDRLTTKISKEEVREAVWQCEGSKILGPTGLILTSLKDAGILLNKRFYKLWKVLKTLGKFQGVAIAPSSL